MHRSVPARLLVIGIAAASLTALPLSGPVSAATGAQCTKEVGTANLTTATATTTLTGCTPLSATGGSGKTVASIKTSIAKTTWAGGKGTTIVKSSYKAGPKVNKCPKTFPTLLIVGGKVTGGSGAALKAMPIGQAVTTFVCVGKNNSSVIEPGTVAKF